jgi:hypothetical protein
MRQHRGTRTTSIDRGVNIRTALDRLSDWLAMLGWVVQLPFRLIGAIAGFFAAVGRGLLRWTVQICFGLIGFAFVAFVGFALVRVIFHPLFV